MSLSKFQENGHTYYRLYFKCPVCFEQGKSTATSFWSHYDGVNCCCGDIYVGDNAFYKCKRCGYLSHVKNWGYKCPSHSNSAEELVVVGSAAIAGVISCASQMVTETGQLWLMQFMNNLGE